MMKIIKITENSKIAKENHIQRTSLKFTAYISKDKSTDSQQIYPSPKTGGL